MKFLTRISILYLTIPVILFLFGWIRLFIALPSTLVVLFALWQIFRQSIPDSQFTDSRPPISQFPNHQFSSIFYLFLLTGIWLFLSGIGGYTFQNWDHNWRNAVFHDLINFNFPVYYTQPDSGPIKMLVYYVGYWLPSALVGKALGWQAANFTLFLWTWFGAILVALHLASALKTSPVKSTLLLIFFSGLDVLGTLFFAKDYPTLLPPITHLEIWSGSLQYSSFTTQLFWVFNQAVPAWLCISMIVILSREAAKSLSPVEPETLPGTARQGRCRSQRALPQSDIRSQIIFLWSLCFFFAPLASIGLFPYILIELIKQTDFKSPFKHLNPAIILSSIIIFFLSSFFFTANTAAQSRGFHSIPFTDFVAFFLLEGGLLWLVLAPSKYRDPRWMVTGILLAIIPFVQLGTGRDFVMRASIAPLFYLMLMTGETIFQRSTHRFLLIALYLLLVLGSLTPLYEINRSIYRTYEYYFVLDRSACGCDAPAVVTHLEQGVAPEAEHPTTLTADGIPTLKFMNDELSKNFIANVRQTLFYKYLARH